jgi:hypothetical protein
MLGQPVPEELFATNITTSRIPQTVVGPVGLIRPTLDGYSSSYFEWLAAGIVETDTPSGTMTSGDQHQPVLKRLSFGFDLEHLYLRFDMATPALQKLTEGIRCSVNFTTPADRRLVLSASGSRASAVLYRRDAIGAWVPLDAAKPQVAAAGIVEAAVAFADLGLSPSSPFGFFVLIQNGSVDLERHPANRPVETAVPEATFEKFNWRA